MIVNGIVQFFVNRDELYEAELGCAIRSDELMTASRAYGWRIQE